MAQRTSVPTDIQRINARDTHAAIERLARLILQRHPADEQLLFLGIANGGIVLARRLALHFKRALAGTLDISFHRDDIGRHPIPKEFAPTHIPADVNGARILLVDDVLQSGRTINAALNELFDHGRPERVELAVLIDRGDRRLPIAPDFSALQLITAPDEKIIVHIAPDTPAKDHITIAPAPPTKKKTAG
ncbi:MAG: bifunctional pyr operon transcriptional regulator/uracil phosphoribosyltransferase PyrR [Opitutaceae bacterium]|jgi:pyrimidine operon attenuation protein/uracil phosphoribosyltransferase|nr:bifunctional pyr operon transcriptional regulator/uracil phosphoribosyltransferase PyrR [Opitutaceae bacterium]